jgi:hypothetical protein
LKRRKAGPPKFPIPTSSHIIFISVVRLRVDGVERVEVWIASTSSSQRVKFKERNGKRSRTHRTFSSGRWDRDEKSKNRKGFGSEFAMQKHMVFGHVISNFLAFYAVTKTSTPGLSKSASSNTLKTL